MKKYHVLPVGDGDNRRMTTPRCCWISSRPPY